MTHRAYDTAGSSQQRTVGKADQSKANPGKADSGKASSAAANQDVTSKGIIVLIGMPGAGKSTVGPLLAERLGLSYIDTDERIILSDGRSPREIVAEEGVDRFLEIQKEVILSIKPEGCVIATGGGVVNSSDLMEHFGHIGRVIYLKQEPAILDRRLDPGRKLARADGQTFVQLFEQRDPLYSKYADYIIDCARKAPEKIVQEIING